MNKKTSLYLQLAILIMIFAGVCGFFITLMTGRGFNINSIFNRERKGEDMEDSQAYNFSGIEKFDIDAVSYAVKVVTHSGSDVIVEKNSSRTVILGYKEEDEIYTSGNTLHFKEGKSLGIGVFNMFGEIIIKVPENSRYEYDLNTVSGSVAVDAQCQDIDINTVSGSIKVNNDGGDKIEAKSVSGSIKIYKPYKDISAKSTSGSIRVAADKNTDKIYAKSTSGGVRISIDGEVGYTMEYSTVSGSVKDIYHDISYGKSGNATYGDKKIQIEAKTTSASIKLENWD